MRSRRKGDGRDTGKEDKVEEQESGVKVGLRNSRAIATKLSKT